MWNKTFTFQICQLNKKNQKLELTTGPPDCGAHLNYHTNTVHRAQGHQQYTLL